MTAALAPTSAPAEARPGAGASAAGASEPIPSPVKAPIVLRVALVVAYIGTAILRPQISGGLAMVDPLIGAICLFGLWSMTMVGSTATRALSRTLVWMWLILVGSVLGLAHVGITAWAIESLTQTTLALLTFFCFWHLIEVYKMHDTAQRGVVLALLVAVLSLLLVPYRWRAEGWFPNPNYPGHFGVLACALLLSIGSFRTRVFALVSMAIVLWTTASFGAIAMAVVMVAVVIIRAVERYALVLIVALGALVLITILLLAAPANEVETESGTWQVKGVISEERFERSQESRFNRWGPALEVFADQPWGVGPNGIKQLTVDGWSFEVHSEPVGFLVERGVIGLVGLIGVWVVIWRSARPFGVARLLIPACLVAAIFRETIHYRHMWMFLALAMAIDQARSAARERAAVDEVAAATPAHPSPTS